MGKRIQYGDIVSRTEKIKQEKDEVLFNDACLAIDRNIQKAADNGLRQSAYTPNLNQRVIKRLMEEYEVFHPEIREFGYDNEDFCLIFRW